MIHVRKVTPNFYEALRDGSKRFELRKEDPDGPCFAVGDYLALNEYDVSRQRDQNDLYTGRCLIFEIAYVLRDYAGLEKGFVVLGLKQPTFSFFSDFPIYPIKND